MMVLVLASIAALPLAGTPTALAASPALSAQLTGVLPQGGLGSGLGVRFALRNASPIPASITLCANALRLRHILLDGARERDIGSDLSYAIRVPGRGYRMSGCVPVALAAGGMSEVDLFYRSGGAGFWNGNRITLATDAGDFIFLSQTIAPGAHHGDSRPDLQDITRGRTYRTRPAWTRSAVTPQG